MTTNWDDDFVEAHPQQRVAAIVQASKLHRKVADSLTEAYVCPRCGSTDIEWRVTDREGDYFQCNECGLDGPPEYIEVKELGPTSETRPVQAALVEALRNSVSAKFDDVDVYPDSVYIATKDRLSVDLLREAMEDSGYSTTDVVTDPDDGFGIWAYL